MLVEKTAELPSMKTQKESHNNTCILELPNHILEQIFCKIPLKTLVQCMFVCKFWRRLILDPQFTEQFFSRTACLLLTSDEVHFLATATLKNASSSPNHVTLKLSKDPVVLTTSDVNIVGSCNGLLCLYEYQYKNKMRCRFYISNPITSECLALPTPPGGEISHLPCGFGFSPMSGAYKLVRFRFGGRWPIEWDPEPEVLVLTVGSGAWRTIGKFKCHLEHQLYAICVSGFLHWIDLSRAVICAFDLESEGFQELPLPPGWDLEGRNESRLDLGALKGCLSLSVTVGSEDTTSIWVMKEHGVKESWSLELKIVDIVVKYPLSHVLKFGEGQFLLLDHVGKLRTYAPRKGFVDVEFDGRYFVGARVHIPSFVSPKHIIRG